MADNETEEKPATAAKKATATKAAAKKAAPAKKAAAAKKAPAKKAAAAKAPKPVVEAEPKERGARKQREGIVATNAMDKTAVVVVTTRKPHPLYRKTMVRTKKLFAHDEQNEARPGDRVRIAETRPLSKQKRWRVVEILERAK
jgi:small subunit ribosomal protein S17